MAVDDLNDLYRATVGEALKEPSGLIRVSASVYAGETLLAGWLARQLLENIRNNRRREVSALTGVNSATATGTVSNAGQHSMPTNPLPIYCFAECVPCT